jgi:dipeptidase E
LEEADVLLVGGGATFYLSYWLQQSGLANVLPQWLKSKVYVGISAGSQVAGSSLRSTGEALEAGVISDDEYNEIGPKGQSSGKALGLVDFAFRPHLNSLDFPKIRVDYLTEVAKTLEGPMYALDDQSALKIVDSSVEVVSQGEWHLFE